MERFRTNPTKAKTMTRSGRKNFHTTGTLPGPAILGNRPQYGDIALWQLPNVSDGELQCIKSDRVGFTYSVHRGGVYVHSDLNSDYAIRRVWKNRHAAKAVEKARRKLASYGALIGLDELIADGWTVV